LILKDVSDILEVELYKSCLLQDLFSSASSPVRIRRAAQSVCLSLSPGLRR
jgi:hypothetical protein